MIPTLVDMMERHIDRIRIFKAQASPAYMSLTYINDPVSHAFDCTKKAALGISREPEFKSDFVHIQEKCRLFAVDLLNACRNSKDVEIILDDPSTVFENHPEKVSFLRAHFFSFLENNLRFFGHNHNTGTI